MLRSAALFGILCAAVVLSDFCKTTTGHWSSGLVDGANDFATTGVTPNDKYFCWEACLNSAMVNQKFKVLLANPPAMSPAYGQRHMLSYQEAKAMARKPTKTRDDSDPNAQFCIDPVLRADINAALLKVTNHSAAAIARTLQYQIARPNWVYNVVELKEGLTSDSLFQDMNFCLYITDLDPELYDIRLAAIDMS